MHKAHDQQLSLHMLPPEVIDCIVPYLPLSSLPATALTSHFAAQSLASPAFALYARDYVCRTLKYEWNAWKPSRRARESFIVRSMFDRRSAALSDLEHFPRHSMPVCHVWDREGGHGRVVFAHGHELSIYEVDRMGRPFVTWRGSPEPRSKASLKRGPLDDIADVAFVDGEKDELFVSRLSGAIQKMRFGRDGLYEVARYASNGATVCNNMQTTAKLLVTTRTSRPGVAQRSELPSLLEVQPKHSPWTRPETVALQSRPWSLLCMDDRIIVGGSSSAPLVSYEVAQDRIVESKRFDVGAHVYALAPVPHKPSCLVAGSYDGTLGIYDVRSASKTAQQTFSDRFSDDPIYAVSLNEERLVAGGARHSSLRCFDTRTGSGWTTFVGRDDSPVYSVVQEGRYVWTATERKASVLEWSEFNNITVWKHDS